MRREFTGRHMAMILVAGFGVVVAVNFFMATLAARNFSGVVVENSYVASQKFNGWLEEARSGDRLGWKAKVTRNEAGHLAVSTIGVPDGASVTAELRRPLGAHENLTVPFSPSAPDEYRSADPVPEGRWTARLAIEHGDHRWAQEVRIE
ncbi:MAG: hypothetical protein EP341_08320 [Sphingomonadales bacterium]|nr:MAG: hypothetical protein EP341_08320 [Sphingomonadales bacterium]